MSETLSEVMRTGRGTRQLTAVVGQLRLRAWTIPTLAIKLQLSERTVRTAINHLRSPYADPTERVRISGWTRNRAPLYEVGAAADAPRPTGGGQWRDASSGSSAGFTAPHNTVALLERLRAAPASWATPICFDLNLETQRDL